jgi:hypothetical protein
MQNARRVTDVPDVHGLPAGTKKDTRGTLLRGVDRGLQGGDDSELEEMTTIHGEGE